MLASQRIQLAQSERRQKLAALADKDTPTEAEVKEAEALSAGRLTRSASGRRLRTTWQRPCLAKAPRSSARPCSGTAANRQYPQPGYSLSSIAHPPFSLP